jgi:hypothetical protein
MRRYHQLRPPHCREHGRRGEPRLAALVSGEYELARSHRHAMQLWAVVQCQQPALHPAPGCELRHHRRQMPPCALYSAICVELGKQTDDHAPSLPTAAPEGKAAIVPALSLALCGKTGSTAALARNPCTSRRNLSPSRREASRFKPSQSVLSVNSVAKIPFAETFLANLRLSVTVRGVARSYAASICTFRPRGHVGQRIIPACRCPSKS